MNDAELDAMLQSTFADRSFTRSERKAVRSVLEGVDERRLATLRSQAFELVRGQLERRSDVEAIAWLEEVVKALVPDSGPASALDSTAHFSPGTDCLEAILGQLRNARTALDVCVFTITDDRISKEIGLAHLRGVKVRVISDDEKAHDLGSDVLGLARAGIPVATDATGDHMHHKFAIIDGRTLINGSFNWTRSATSGNLENVVVTNDPALVRGFAGEFERLWKQLPALTA